MLNFIIHTSGNGCSNDLNTRIEITFNNKEVFLFYYRKYSVSQSPVLKAIPKGMDGATVSQEQRAKISWLDWPKAYYCSSIRGLGGVVTTVKSFKDVPAGNNNTNIMDQKVATIEKASNTIKDITESLGNGNNNFISDLNLQVLYDFLDSLTLLEESAFLHIFIFIYILLCIFNIIAVFFGNEIIQYFKLETKYPKLELFFKIRNKFQRYYLMWNVSLIVLVCFLAIFLNLLVFYKHS